MKLIRFIILLINSPAMWGWIVFIGSSIATFINLNPSGFVDNAMAALLSITIGLMVDFILFLFVSAICAISRHVVSAWRNA